MLGSPEVAQICGVTRETVSQWCRMGTLPATRLGMAKKKYKVMVSALVRFLSRTETGRRHWGKAAFASAAAADAAPFHPRRPKYGAILDVSDVAGLTGASPRTVRRWIERGTLRAHGRGIPGSRFRVKERDLFAFLTCPP